MIDLHSHTDQSDGSTPPELLVDEAQQAGLRALAITDHDTFAGFDLALPHAESVGLELICGVELSTRWSKPLPEGQRAPSIHVLGYFLDNSPATEFRDWLWNWQESRRKRNLALIARLQSLGIEITLEEVRALGKNLTGRPHFAKVLLKKGYVASVQEAFDVYLADEAKASVHRDEPTAEEGIEHIVAGGGVAVLAHPFRLREGRDRDALRETLRDWKEHGLGGIETYYSEHTPEHTALYESLGTELGLALTGGSDYHGSNKPGIALGSGRNGNLSLQYSLLSDLRTKSSASSH